jgi:acetyl esterase/lipase
VPLPNQILAVSAGVNLTMSSHKEEVTKLKRVDPVLDPATTMQARRMWVGQAKHATDPIPAHIVQDPCYNPSVGDCSIFKQAGTQLVLVSGTYDTMHPYVSDFVESAGRGGAATVFIEGKAQFHDFPLARTMIPEGNEASQAIADAILAYSNRNV